MAHCSLAKRRVWVNLWVNLHTIVIHALYIIHYTCTNTYTHKVLEYDYLCCIYVKNLIHRQEWPVVFFMQIGDMKHCLFETQTGLAVDRVHPCDAALAGQASVTPAPEWHLAYDHQIWLAYLISLIGDGIRKFNKCGNLRKTFKWCGCDTSRMNVP